MELPIIGPDIRIGTSGYDYPEWKGSFYPVNIARKDFLGFYSELFNTLEINFTYYGQPRPEIFDKMLGRLRRPIDFSVKAYRTLTHERVLGSLPASAHEFRTGIRPLVQAGCLAAVLLEFPSSFHYCTGERIYLARLLDELEGLPLVVELRNAEWYSARVLEALRERNVGLCILDAPRLPGLPPAADLVTADFAYIRFHGRNASSWWTGDAGSRYEYFYNREELSAWVPRLGALGAQARRIRIYFNNHRRGNAAANALDFARLAASSGLLPDPS